MKIHSSNIKKKNKPLDTAHDAPPRPVLTHEQQCTVHQLLGTWPLAQSHGTNRKMYTNEWHIIISSSVITTCPYWARNWRLIINGNKCPQYCSIYLSCYLSNADVRAVSISPLISRFSNSLFPITIVASWQFHILHFAFTPFSALSFSHSFNFLLPSSGNNYIQ